MARQGTKTGKKFSTAGSTVARGLGKIGKEGLSVPLGFNFILFAKLLKCLMNSRYCIPF